jgi:hypothetical protein
MAEIAQSRGAVDRRAGVVAFVAQLDFAGMHADTQPLAGRSATTDACWSAS